LSVAFPDTGLVQLSPTTTDPFNVRYVRIHNGSDWFCVSPIGPAGKNIGGGASTYYVQLEDFELVLKV
jgi:hypothetical protein